MMYIDAKDAVQPGDVFNIMSAGSEFIILGVFLCFHSGRYYHGIRYIDLITFEVITTEVWTYDEFTIIDYNNDT